MRMENRRDGLTQWTEPERPDVVGLSCVGYEIQGRREWKGQILDNRFDRIGAEMHGCVHCAGVKEVVEDLKGIVRIERSAWRFCSHSRRKGEQECGGSCERQESSQQFS